MRHVVVVTLTDNELGDLNVRISPEGIVRRVYMSPEEIERIEPAERAMLTAEEEEDIANYFRSQDDGC